MFCFGLQSIRTLHQHERVLYNTVGWRVKENFPETFKSQLEKNKKVIHRPRPVCIGRNCALRLSTALGLWPGVVLKTSWTVSSNMDLPAGE